MLNVKSLGIMLLVGAVLGMAALPGTAWAADDAVNAVSPPNVNPAFPERPHIPGPPVETTPIVPEPFPSSLDGGTPTEQNPFLPGAVSGADVGVTPLPIWEVPSGLPHVPL